MLLFEICQFIQNHSKNIMQVKSIFNIDQIQISMLDRVAANKNLRCNKQTTSKSNQETEISALNFEEFANNAQNFCHWTQERSGNQADEALREIISEISSVNTINEDVSTFFKETDFFECSSYCINPYHPSLLLHVIEVYSKLSFLSTPFIKNLVDSRILESFCTIFTNCNWNMSVFEALIKLFSNTCSSSPEARKLIYEKGVFNYLCNLLAVTEDNKAIELIVKCINSFFPDAQLVAEEFITDSMLIPMMEVLRRYAPNNSTIYKKMREDILYEVLSAISKFSTTQHNIIAAAQCGIANLLLQVMDQIEKPNLYIIFETISVILSLNDSDIIEALLPDINLKFFIDNGDRVVCDILSSLFIASEEIVMPAIELGIIEMGTPILDQGSFEEKVSAAVMFSAAILRVTDSVLIQYFNNVTIIESMLEFCSSCTETSFKNLRPIVSSLERIKSVTNDEEIIELFNGFEFE